MDIKYCLSSTRLCDWSIMVSWAFKSNSLLHRYIFELEGYWIFLHGCWMERCLYWFTEPLFLFCLLGKWLTRGVHQHFQSNSRVTVEFHLYLFLYFFYLMDSFISVNFNYQQNEEFFFTSSVQTNTSENQRFASHTTNVVWFAWLVLCKKSYFLFNLSIHLCPETILVWKLMNVATLFDDLFKKHNHFPLFKWHWNW